MYLLDTNVCIVFLQGRNESLRQQMDKVPSDQICLCSIVASELLYGAAKSKRQQETLVRLNEFLACFRICNFDLAAAHRFGQIRADLYRQGLPIGPYDLQIAAIALANQLVLVTHNVAEFSRVPDLQCVDWETT